MPSAYSSDLESRHRGDLGLDVRMDSATLAGKFIQQDVDENDVYINDKGFHNHLVHHLLAMHSLSAPPEVLIRVNREENELNRHVPEPRNKELEDLGDPRLFAAAMGQRENYVYFLRFFQRVLQDSSIGDVLRRFLFAKDELAESMLIRLFDGILHPFIHLGYGVEFDQPMIVAQALAMAATSQTSLQDFLLKSEEMASSQTRTGTDQGSTSRPLCDIIEKDLKELAPYDPVDVADFSPGAVISRGPPGFAEKLTEIASRFSVGHASIRRKFAEILGTTAYFTGALQRPDKAIKLDFFAAHNLTSDYFCSVFIKAPWMDDDTKVRLLEWKARANIAHFAAIRAWKIEPRPQDITDYQPRGDWDQLMKSHIYSAFPEAHAVKIFRSLYLGHLLSESFAGEGRMTEDMWLKLGYMAYDSMKGPHIEYKFVFGAGRDQSWSGIGPRE